MRRIVTTAHLQLNLAQQGVVLPRSTENLEAYDDVLRGTEYMLAFTKDGNGRARQAFEQAIALDPRYAAAYGLLGFNYWVSWRYAFEPDPNLPTRGLKLEQQALALDDSLAFAQSVSGVIYATSGHQWARGLAEAQRGVALDPNSAFGYLSLVEVLDESGKAAEALAASGKGMRLDPRNPLPYLFHQGWAYFLLGRLDEAISLLKPWNSRYPDTIGCHALLAMAYGGLGDLGAAQAEVAEVQRLVALAPDSAVGNFSLIQALNGTGRSVEALAVLDHARRIYPWYSDTIGGFLPQRGWADSQLGRWQEAISVLKRVPSTNLPWPNLPWLHVWLAVDYVELGRDDDARAEVAEILKLDPEFTAKIGSGAFPANREHAIADLHKAGLK